MGTGGGGDTVGTTSKGVTPGTGGVGVALWGRCGRLGDAVGPRGVGVTLGATNGGVAQRGQAAVR